MEFSALFGSDSATNTLLFITNYGKGYCREIAETFQVSVSMIKNQLNKFEQNGVLVASEIGRTRVFEFNPRYPYKKELLSLLEKRLSLMSEKELKLYYRKRTRPRKKGKPL